ncbi:hypothetical protein G9C98_004936 [Cotesia typhae]|uniref:Polycomb protein Suz12 n=1 Tax=Cotesia typhae TaxID=2053667 RepID=A0A8J5UU07_9HYME|nr:hypothetical protein G9C98_004936 [Cotesia typhae]
MPPKKRDKELESQKTPRTDQIQADHELFLQAFEKPTQIYRFLRTRNQISPVFLYRNLSYMKERMSRSHKTRCGFRVKSILEKLMARNSIEQNPEIQGYMTLTFLGFYDKKIEGPQDPVKVETLLLKICHKKRKDVTSPTMQVSFGTSEVPINPSEDHPPPTAPTISISNESFSLNNGHVAKTYMLLLRVYCMSNNSCLLNNCDLDAEPAQKRRKSSSGSYKCGEQVKLYGSELIVYDKHNRCLLTDGDYELSLQEVQTNVRSSPKKHSSWESIVDIKECGPFEVFSRNPTLKFRLSWTVEPSNSRQQTEACEDLHCPWCSLDCGKLYSLLKHLKLCHSRFTFTYVPISQGARIDVAINECYDGSYAGSPHELISQPSGVAFSRTGPTRRTSVTNILVCRPKRTKPSLSEFLELDENEFESQRPYITGHNRLYHHTVTCLPIYPKEMDIDSEGENDPRWLQTKTMMMIDDFTDVNEGEKELMKMWNLHVMKYGYVGDCQIPLACQMFLDFKGKKLLMKNLYRNFLLHMSSLFDFGLISPVILYQTIQKLQEIMKEGGEDGDVRKILQKSHEAQVERWISTGMHASSDNIKSSNTIGKTHFNNEGCNSNARRKTCLQLGSPPSAQTVKSSIHNTVSKHASMISTPSTKSLLTNTSQTSIPFSSVQSTLKKMTSNDITVSSSNIITKTLEINCNSNNFSPNDRQANEPIRRKSTNSIVMATNNLVPLRRKSMASDNPNSEYYKRKLLLDAIPSVNSANPKMTLNDNTF